MDLDIIQAWSDKWSFEFGPSKCRVMYIEEGARRLDTEYRLWRKKLKTVLKDLGVSTVLSMLPEPRINLIISAANAHLANPRVIFSNINKVLFWALYTCQAHLAVCGTMLRNWRKCRSMQQGLF